MDLALMANALRNQTDEQPVLTPDGRQVSQRQYRLEQQRGEQTAKLDSLKENPLASGMYGATGNDTATGVTAGLEGILYSLGSMAFARGAQGTRQVPHNSLVDEGMPSREAQKGYPGVKPAIGMNDWALEKMASEKAELQKNQRLRAKSLLDMLKTENPSDEWSTGGPRQVEDWAPAYRGSTPGAEEQARIDAHRKLGLGDMRIGGQQGRADPGGPANRQTMDEATLGLGLNPEGSPQGYAERAQAQQREMPNFWRMENMSGERPRSGDDYPWQGMVPWNTRAEELVSSGNWAKPMAPIADLSEALRKQGKSVKQQYYPDSRPRHDYRLPDGTVVPIIFDHDEEPPPSITWTGKDGKVITIPRVPPNE